MNARTMLHAAFAPKTPAGIALPSLEELQEELSAAAGDLQEVQSQMDDTAGQIEDLQDELGSAQNLQAAVESLAGSTSPAAHRAVGIILDHHLARFNITLPSMEEDATPEAQTAVKAEANESLIKRIIAAIQAAVARVKAYIKKVWAQITSGRDRVKAAVEAAAKHVESLSGEKVTVRMHPAIHDMMTYNGKLLGDELIGNMIGTHNLRPLTDAITPVLMMFGDENEALRRVLEATKGIHAGVAKLKARAKKEGDVYRIYGGRHGVETPFDVVMKAPEGDLDGEAQTAVHYLNGITFSLVPNAGGDAESQSQEYTYTKGELAAAIKSADASLKTLD